MVRVPVAVPGCSVPCQGLDPLLLPSPFASESISVVDLWHGNGNHGIRDFHVIRQRGFAQIPSDTDGFAINNC
jgi:hypothetical protein